MSLREREGGADDDAEPEDLPNLVRGCILRSTGRQCFLLRAMRLCNVYAGAPGDFGEEDCIMTKKQLALAVAIAALGTSTVWMSNVSAAEKETVHGGGADAVDTYELDPVDVEGQRDEKNTENFVAAEGTVGFLGEKTALETPFTTTNITKETIASFGDPSQPLDSVLSISPSIRPTGSILHNDFQHRGFRANGTSTYVNNVPGMFTQFNAPMYVIERADVISGPNSGLAGTGTQYESTAAGGIVNFTTKRAGAEDLRRLTLTHSGQSMNGVYFDLGHRFGKNKEWGVRLNAEKVHGETAVDGQKVKSAGIFINIDHEDAKSKTNFFTGYRQNQIVGGQRWFKIGAGVTKLPAVPKASRSYSFEGMDKESYGWMMILNHEQKLSSDWKWFVNAGMLKNKLNRNVMYQYSALTILNDNGDFDLSYQRTTTPQRANYIQTGFTGKFETGNANHEMTIAVDRAWRGREAATASPTLNIGTGNIYTGVFHQTGDPRTDYSIGMNNKTSIKGISLVDSITLNKWNMILGVHHHSSNVKAYNLTTGRVSSSVDSSATTPTYTLSYRPTEDITVYASHAEYFDVGTVVSTSYQNAGTILPPFKTKQNELGVKYANKDILYSLAFFDIKQASNIAVNRGAAKDYLEQDGEERHRGIELGIGGRLAPKWSVAAGLAYMQATYERTAKGAKDGRTPDGQPRWNGTLMARYAADDKFSAFARMTYAGAAWTYNQKFKVPSNAVFDVGMNYKTNLGSVPTTFGLTVYNVLNKEYWMASRSDQSLYLSTPRTFALTMAMDI